MTIEISRLEINDTDIGCVVSADTVVEDEDMEEDLLVGIRLVAPSNCTVPPIATQLRYGTVAAQLQVSEHSELPNLGSLYTSVLLLLDDGLCPGAAAFIASVELVVCSSHGSSYDVTEGRLAFGGHVWNLGPTSQDTIAQSDNTELLVTVNTTGILEYSILRYQNIEDSLLSVETYIYMKVGIINYNQIYNMICICNA